MKNTTKRALRNTAITVGLLALLVWIIYVWPIVGALLFFSIFPAIGIMIIFMLFQMHEESKHWSE